MIQKFESRVIIRNYDVSDAPLLAAIANNWNIAKNLRDGFPHPYSHSDAVSFIEKSMTASPTSVFAIEYQKTLAGTIGLSIMSDVYRHSAEVGYFVREDYWGRGIATEALKLLINYAFNDLNLVRLFTGVYENNKSSMKVLQKCGFFSEGIKRKAVWKSSKYLDEHTFGLINNKMMSREK